ncbi:glycosyltransferase family 2 protein [Pseudooceanicola sp.]|uniref:glycosyltransferase family 2 protein n=1 Tax=Pseudooceanicola sp. TaxID=1914328 RepID=UPI002620BBB0|nr:glycosyltransferase family 2 protein [Pseudooceanicola sp.]MDF1855603.1 glycosyltransferase family 2 protein [Pseudooceanicola sp.]
MRIYLHIGLEHVGAERLQAVLVDKRAQLIGKGVLFARSPGNRNHTRLFMAVTDPDHIDPLRFNRGYILPEKQENLANNVLESLRKEVETHRPEVLILSASQLGTSLARVSELERLKALLSQLSDDIRIVAHVDDQARVLARFYSAQVMEGRASSLAVELGLVGATDWWAAARAAAPEIAPQLGVFQENQAPAFWLDYQQLMRHWEGVFGAGSVQLRPFQTKVFSAIATEELRAAFDIEENIGKAGPVPPPAQPAAAWVARGRQMNTLLLRLLAKGDRVLPRPLWTRIMEDFRVDGDPIDPGRLAAISERFADDNAALITAHPALAAAPFTAPDPGPTWTEADPTFGFRASQYLLAFRWRIDKATADAQATKVQAMAALNGTPAPKAGQPAADAPSAAALKVMPPLAVEKYREIVTSPFRPHNRLGQVNEEELAAAYTPVPPRDLPEGSSGRVIVGCMKNEAPYIIEWVAYHRAIGFDNFLIYTNDCSDGTDKILQRLDAMGIVQHRDNDGWTGNSPQQFALDAALNEPVLKNAEWIAHIDVDEFVNIRCGNGTLDDFFERVSHATNVAMTWRLFGHNGVTRYADEFVIEQFDSCAPKFCPKPHTAWGFKTMFRNIGAYGKLSCHRPNKPAEDRLGDIAWVNGSGAPMGGDVVRNGWRNSKRSIGYDLIQLNHYALRSAESYLVKRQRGRALHVDRSIGMNYWVRMDWNDFKDITIKRNLPRLRAAYDALLADTNLQELHLAGVDWHRDKAAELHENPEFQKLYEQTLTVHLNETERVAYALALDMES